MTQKTPSTKRAFTLIELLISVFMFLLIMLGFVSVFGDTVDAYRTAREMQRNMENVQFAANFVAKTLRTSTMMSTDGEHDTVRVFDHSQQECLEFSFTYDAVNERDTIVMTQKPEEEATPILEHECPTTGRLTESIPLTTGELTGRFYVVVSQEDDITTPLPTFEGIVGRVTMFLEIQSELQTDNRTQYVQTSVSLRDYGNTGLSF